MLQYNCGSSRRDARNATIKDHYEKLNHPDPVKASVNIKGPAEAGTTLAPPQTMIVGAGAQVHAVQAAVQVWSLSGMKVSWRVLRKT